MELYEWLIIVFSVSAAIVLAIFLYHPLRRLITKKHTVRVYYKTVYKVKSDKVAGVNASKLLGNARVSEYLSETMHQTKVNDILDINGVLDNLSQLAIGKPRKKVFKRISYKGKKPKVEYDNVTTVTPEDQDQLKALELLGKYYKIFTDKVETQTDITVNIDPGDYDG